MKNPLNRHSETANNPSAEKDSRESARENSSRGFRNFAQRLRSPTSPKPTATVFQRVHHPDRPPVPVLPTDIPTEDECRVLLKQTARSPGFKTIIKQEVSERRADRERADHNKTAAMESQKQKQQKVQRDGSVVAGPPSRKMSVGASRATAPTSASAQRSTRPPTTKSSPTSATAQGAPRPLRRVPNLASVSQGSSRSSREAASQVAKARPSVRTAHSSSSSSSSANSTRRQLPSKNEPYTSPRPAPNPPALIPFSKRMATLAVAVDQPLVQGRTRGPVPVVVSIPRRTSSTGAVKRQTEGERRAEDEKLAEGKKTEMTREKVRQQYEIHQSRRIAWSPLAASSGFERLGDQTASSTASEQDVAVAAAIAEAEAESGESLLEWDIEVIKASVEGSWRKQNCRQRSAMANQRATAAGPTSSPSTKPTATTMTARMSATACLLQCLTSVPPEVAARVGIVTVGVVAQPSNVRIEQAATRTSIALSGSSNDAYDDDDEIQSQHGEMLEGWTGSEYYFEGGGSRR